MAGVSLLLVGCGLVTGYLLTLAFYRLFLSPIAHFPGPRLAALSNWYEFYYDVIQQGRFTAHIQKLHKQYGPIIRITPTELHIDDPEYYDTLYTRASGRRNKSPYFAGRFGNASDSFSTVDHDLHRLRRKAISPFFSAAKITDFQPVIRSKAEKLCLKLEQYARPGPDGDGEVAPLSRALMALTTDIITEYAFAKSYNHLESPRFRETMHEALVSVYVTGHFALHFPVLFPILDLLPDWLVRWANPDIMPVAGWRKDLAEEVNEIRHDINHGYKTVSHPTVFHEVLLNDDLPPEEKSDARLGDEAQLIVAAGLITTSWALTVASFHLSNSPDKLATLRKELAGSGMDGTPEHPFDWNKLSKLPFFSAVVHESVRLAHGIVTRDPRMAPDTELMYGKWKIPRNTPVSMTMVDILMNETIFPEPRKFVPERWLERPDRERFFVPFGKGSRQCLGINLAQAELYITLATLFSRFNFELFETDLSDVEMAHAYLVPYPKWNSKGVRARVQSIA